MPSILVTNFLVKSPNKPPILNHQNVSSHQNVLYNSVAKNISNLQLQLNYTAHFWSLEIEKKVVWNWWFGWCWCQRILNRYAWTFFIGIVISKCYPNSDAAQWVETSSNSRVFHTYDTWFYNWSTENALLECFNCWAIAMSLNGNATSHPQH